MIFFKRVRPTFLTKLAVFWSLLFLLTGSLVIFSPGADAAETQAPPDPKQFQYFSQTGHSVSGAVLRFYNSTGGLARHGLPLSEVVRHDKIYMQVFERSVLEFHPEYINTPAEVNLLPIGSFMTGDRNFQPVTPFESTAENWYFPETGFSLSGDFLNFWRNNGGRESLGLPISQPQAEEQPNGIVLTVQYFENVKLEYHPEATDSKYLIQIGLLGAEKAAELADWQRAPVPLANFSTPRATRIPSLMFHYVREVDRTKDPLGFGLSITPKNFVAFLDWIKQNGYNTVTSSQILDYIKYGIPLPPKAVNLRFDDGYASMWFAYQEMKKRDITATFFVVTRRLELLPEQWKQIDQDGFEVAAHTRTHPDLRGVKDLVGEITGSKQDLEAILGHPVRVFAYPYGKFGPTITKVTQDSGFEMALSTLGGYNWNAESMFQQPTISVIGDDTVASFASKITAVYPAPAPAPKPTVTPKG